MSFSGNLAEIVDLNENGLLSNHESWVRVNLGLVADIVNGFPFNSQLFIKGSGIPLIRIRDISNKFTDVGYLGDAPNGYWVKQEDILIGMDGDFNIAKWHGPDALLNQRVCKLVVNPQFFEKGFLYYVIGGYLKAINSYTSSITVKHLSSGTISDIPIPLPPLPEQKRIAAKLDTLLARVEACRDRLEAVPRLLKRFRQAVLAAATSGELTAEWREKNQLPKNFLPTRIESLAQIDIGFAFKSAEFLKEGIRLLRGDNIEPGRLRWRDAKHFDPDKLRPFEHLFLKEGDIVLAMDRPLISSGLKLARVRKEDIPSVLVQRVCRFRPLPQLASSFLYLTLSTREFIEYLREEQNGTQIPHISGSQILGFAISLPPLSEQAEIVRRVEALFAVADRLEARYTAARKQVDQLTPALLAKAFRGELVPQDPTDEPAAVLLARIRARREDGAREAAAVDGGQPALFEAGVKGRRKGARIA